MTTPEPTTPVENMTTPEPATPVEKLEQDALVTGYAAAGAIRGIEVAAIVLIGLLIVPPLAILAVVVVVPLLAIALVVALLAAVLTVPYLLVRHLRSHHGGHGPLLAHRLRVAGRAVLDLAPHRIDAAARKLHSGR
jgi:predicted membrane metal-binding protein